jgi:hypothetical protein
MKLHRGIFLLFACALLAFRVPAATTTISGLTELVTPSTNSWLELADMLASPKSRKIALTNAVEAGLKNTGVTAGTYGNASYSATVTVDAKGRVTSITTNAIAAGSSVFVDGAEVTDPDFAGDQFTAAGSDVNLSSTLVSTNNQGVFNPVDLGTGTSFPLDALISRYTAEASGNFTFSIATNAPTDPEKEYDLYVGVYDAAGGKLAAVSGFTPEYVGNWGTNKLGTNIYHFWWSGGIWHAEQNTAQLSALGVGSGNVSDAELEALDGLTGTIATSTSTTTFTGKTIDASASGNVLKFTDYQQFIYPSRVDGTGCIIGTTNTANVWGLASYSGSADTNGNYAIFRIGTVPYDLDTGVAMTLKGLSIRVDGSDTDAAEFTIALYSPSSSGAGSPSDFTACSTFINFDTGALTSPALGDTFFCSDVTLTGWPAALTPGRPWIIAIARRNGSNDDIVSITAGAIEYGRTK